MPRIPTDSAVHPSSRRLAASFLNERSGDNLRSRQAESSRTAATVPVAYVCALGLLGVLGLLSNDADRLSGTADAKSDAAKEARLRDLERRKKDLEAALATLVKR